MQLRFVALDLGNVLCDLSPAAFGETLARAAGVPFEVAAAAFDQDAWQGMEIGDVDAATFRQRVIDRLGVPIPNDVFDAAWCLIPTARAGADALVRRLRLPHAIWSNTDPIHAAHLTASLAAIRGAVHQHLSFSARCRKPDRVYYERGLSALGAQPGEVLFIDDRADNREAAAELGILVEAAWTLAEVHAALDKHGLLGP